MSLYNFGYTTDYYNTHQVIKQICDICGEEQFSEIIMEKCIICDQNICSSCNAHGFCGKHYNSLTLEEKQKIEIQEIQIHKKSNRYFLEIFGLSLLLFIGFIMLALSKTVSWMFFISWILILAPFIVIFKIVFKYFKIINQEIIFKKQIFSNHQ